AVQNSRDIISSMCQLNGTINFDNPKFVQLIDDAREVITVLSPRNSPDLSVSGLSRRLIGEFAGLITEGVGPYLFRRVDTARSGIIRALEFDESRRLALNKVL